MEDPAHLEELQLDANQPPQEQVVDVPPEPNTEQNRERQAQRTEGYKRALRCEILWLGMVNLSLIWALIADSKNECPGHSLKAWVYTMIPLQFIMIVPNGVLQLYMPRLFNDAERRRLHFAGLFYLASRIMNFLWVAWAITGIVWTFGSKTCADKIPVIYVVCYILAVMNSIFIGFPVLICCCTLPTTIAVYLCCPNVLGIRKVRKASPRLIKKVTKSKKFSEALGIPKEDANCAICLCEYEQNEEIRYLRCGHHFHSDCVMQWLVRNLSCPFCKKEIDKKEEKVEEVQKQPAVVDSDDEEEPLDRANLLV
jgi:hypothetical protein